MIEVKLTVARLREMWRNASQNGVSPEECALAQQREIDQLAAIWRSALLLPGQQDFAVSTLHEIGRWRRVDDLATVRSRCDNALSALKLRWEQNVVDIDARQVEKYYDTADDCIEELMWWHTLADDNSPLAYVAALEFAAAAGCKDFLDLGSGVGSGALLFHRHSFAVSLADISSAMLSFCRYRFASRDLAANFIDLKSSPLRVAAFDFITAMDVFEHLVDPVRTVDLLDRSLKPGGYVYGRFASEVDRDRPQHIVQDFAQVFGRFAELGYNEVFHDEWLWGHQVFQKGGGN